VLFHKAYLNNLLQQAQGNITVASTRAGLDRSNFKKIIRKYDIDLKEFRRVNS
jgi:transcriptional regulator of acetoin/glycerol metabolism